MDVQRIMFIPTLIVGLLAFASFFNLETRKCVLLYSDTGKVHKLLRVAFYLLLQIICVLGLSPMKPITVLIGVAFIFNFAADCCLCYDVIASLLVRWSSLRFYSFAMVLVLGQAVAAVLLHYRSWQGLILFLSLGIVHICGRLVELCFLRIKLFPTATPQKRARRRISLEIGACISALAITITLLCLVTLGRAKVFFLQIHILQIQILHILTPCYQIILTLQTHQTQETFPRHSTTISTSTAGVEEGVIYVESQVADSASQGRVDKSVDTLICCQCKDEKKFVHGCCVHCEHSVCGRCDLVQECA